MRAVPSPPCFHQQTGPRGVEMHPRAKSCSEEGEAMTADSVGIFPPKGLDVPLRLSPGCQPTVLRSVAPPQDLSLCAVSSYQIFVVKANTNASYWILFWNMTKALLLHYEMSLAHNETADPRWVSFYSKHMWPEATSIINVASSNLRWAPPPPPVLECLPYTPEKQLCLTTSH